MLLGGVLGSLACAFYLGFFSGQKVGLEMALTNNFSAAMRMPIGSGIDLEDESYAKESPLGEIRDVYAKLREVEVPEPTDLARATGAGSVRASIDTAVVPEAAVPKARVSPELAMVEEVGGAAIDEVQAARVPAPRPAGQTVARKDTLTLGELAQRETQGAKTFGDSKTVVSGRGSSILRDETAHISSNSNFQVASREQRAAVMAPADQVTDVARTTRLSSDAKEAAVVSSAQGKEASRPPAASSLTRSVTDPRPGSASPGLIRERLPKGWFAQVGAPDNRAEAERLGQNLQASGFPVVIEQAKVRGQEYYRILVGPEDTRQQAERLMSQLKREPAVKADPFIRMVR
jgi:cell division septation protein DedD